MRIDTPPGSRSSLPVGQRSSPPPGQRSSPPPRPSTRALAPVAGVLLLAITVVLAGGVVAVGIDAPTDPAPTAMLSLSATDDRIVIGHRGGDDLDANELTVRVRIDGEPLARQPSVPFFSAAGFRPGPTGAFNAASDDTLRAGDSTSFRVAGTNAPVLEPGRTVAVEISVDGSPVASLETVAESK